MLSYKFSSTNYVDSLSRHPDLSEKVESNNKAQTLLLSRLFSDSNKILVKSDKDMHVKAIQIVLSNLLFLI